jgi:hypothetical protein
MRGETHRQNFKPDYWGPGTWRFLHSMAASMPETLSDEEQKHLTTFFNVLPFLLPCERCRINLEEHYQEGYYPKIQTREQLIKSISDLHSKVNSTLPQKPPENSKLPWGLIVLIAILVLVVIVAVARKK